MILSRPDILDYINDGRLSFTPAIGLDQVAQVSIDLHLGYKFTTFKERPSYITSVTIDQSLWLSEDIWHREDHASSHVLEPGHLVLAQTLESVRMPADLCGLVEGRSSWARMGISIHITAPKIDPGFDGQITLEMANLGGLPITLIAGEQKPAQLILFQVTTPLAESELYGARPEDNFQKQTTPIPHEEPASAK